MTTEDRLEEALLRAIELTEDTNDASRAVAKTAGEKSLTRDQTRFVATAYNKAKAFALGGMLSDSQRGCDFQLADPDEVIKLAFEDEEDDSVVKTAEAPISDLPDIDEFLSRKPLRKVAEDIMQAELASSTPEEKDTFETRKARKQLKKQAEEYETVKEKTCKALQTRSLQLKRDARVCLDKAAEEFTSYSETVRPKVARRLLNGFGELKGRSALEYMAKQGGCDLPDVKRTASHSIFPRDKIYTHVADALSKVSSAARADTLQNGLIKQGGPLEDIAASVSYGTLTDGGKSSSPFESLLKDSLGKGKRNKTLEELLPSDVFTRLKALKSRRAFMDAVAVNPDLQDFSLDALEDAFNYAIETNPEAMDSPRLLSNLILHNINQGNVDDVFTMKAKSELGKLDTDKAKGKADTATRLREAADAEKRERAEAKKEADVKGVTEHPMSGPIPEEKIKAGAKALGELLGKGVDKTQEGLDKGKKAKSDVEGAKAEQLRQERDAKIEVAEKLHEYEKNRREQLEQEALSRHTQTMGKKDGMNTQLLGVEDIPVRFANSYNTEYLDPLEVVELREKYEKGDLGPEGNAFVENLNRADAKLEKPVQWNDKAEPREAAVEKILGEVDAKAIQQGGIPTTASSLDELLKGI